MQEENIFQGIDPGSRGSFFSGWYHWLTSFSHRQAVAPAYITYDQTQINQIFIDYLVTRGMPRARLQILVDGLCYGHSIVVAEMHRQGYLTWWLRLLRALVDHREQLKDEAYLEQPALDWLPEEPPKRLQTHGQLLERALNYVVFSHACPKVMSVLGVAMDAENYCQDAYIVPSRRLEHVIYHEVDTPMGAKTIRHGASITGNFDVAALSKLINAVDVKGNVCIVSSYDHACALLYEESTKCFGFFDPNYACGRPKWFADKHGLACEIIRCLGSAISIVLAADSSNQRLARQYIYSLRSPIYCLSRLEGEALPIILRDARPSTIKLMFNNASRLPAFTETLAFTLTRRFEDGAPYFHWVLKNYATFFEWLFITKHALFDYKSWLPCWLTLEDANDVNGWLALATSNIKVAEWVLQQWQALRLPPIQLAELSVATDRSGRCVLSHAMHFEPAFLNALLLFFKDDYGCYGKVASYLQKNIRLTSSGRAPFHTLPWLSRVHVRYFLGPPEPSHFFSAASSRQAAKETMEDVVMVVGRYG